VAVAALTLVSFEAVREPPSFLLAAVVSERLLALGMEISFAGERPVSGEVA
jgi:hypothetical protein